MLCLEQILNDQKLRSISRLNYPNWCHILDQPYKILIIGGSGSGKTNKLLNLIKYQRLHSDKICLYVKDPSKWI